MADGLISVIIPIYNAEKYLQETIQSVLNQTYTNFEIVAVNDGAKDHSLEILQQFTDSRIRIINKVNTGVSDTRNTAIKTANGEFVCFLDADDYLSPVYLQRMYETAKVNHADMVVCNYAPFRGTPFFDGKKAMAVSVQSIETLVQAGVLTSAWTKLIKISTLYKYNILFDKNMTFGEDLFFCWKAYLASENVWMIDEKLYGYRMTNSGATSKYHPELYEKYKAAFADLKQFGKTVEKNDEYAMDVFFTTRMPSFIRMTVREKSRIAYKKNRLLTILADDTIMKTLAEWSEFSRCINQNQVKFYQNCRTGRVGLLLIDGYKGQLRSKLSAIKSKLKG